MSEREMPLVRVAGAVTALLSRGAGRVYRWIAPYVRVVLIALGVVLALPSIAEYWLKHVRLPDVPVSAIVLLLVSSFFILCFTAMLYTVSMLLLQVQAADRTVSHALSSRRRTFAHTDGSFTPGDDTVAWQQEQLEEARRQGVEFNTIDLLAKNGTLKPEDIEAIEEMARSASLLRRGKTD